MNQTNEGNFQGVIGRTVDDSIPWWPNPENYKKDAPNIVVIMLDDLGFAQLGCYGSDISTPNIDKLAENGLRYNNFHTTAMCSPTRASLLTGRNPHSTGMSFVSEYDSGFPNCRGKVRKDTAMLSEMLLEEGYNTFAVGKWHLTPGKEQKHTGPFDGWPLGRGFEQYYGFLRGATSQFHPELVEGNQRVSQPKSAEEGYHLTEDLTDKAIEYIRAQKSEAAEKPFFCYLSYAAPHAPHQAPLEFIDKYKGKYDKGWDEVREDWFARQKELGIIPENAQLPSRNPGVKQWNELKEDEKQLFTRMQEVFAGFLEHTDFHIGRFIQCLKDIEQLDNTVIVFLSDNGACGLGGDEGMVNSWIPTSNAVPETFQSKMARIDELGGPKANSHYPTGWAQAGNTPLKLYKTFTHAGGIRCPLIIHYPERVQDEGAIRTQYHHVTDIVPTILELIGSEAPEIYKGVRQKPIHGTSLLYTFDNAEHPTRKQVQHFEIDGNRGIWKDGWKAVTHHKKGISFEDDEWELYDAENDFSESYNLSAKYPDKLKELIEQWWLEAEKFDVFPLDGRTLSEKLLPNKNKQVEQNGPVHRTFYTASAVFNGLLAPDLRNKSFQIRMEIARSSKEDDGVILAHGDNSGGYTLYIQNNRLVFHYNFSNVQQFVIKSTRELPIGMVTITFLLTKTGEDEGIGRMFVNEQLMGQGSVYRLSSLGFSKGLLFIGKDGGNSVSPDYDAPFTFKGQLQKVKYVLGGYQEDLEAIVKEELMTE
ncbi:arylsulfatase [Alkalihalobacillus deserti]|uniref:arylsulfatase n=1 Tax=Alkalihalobacillus deserti TaxID=2879466 RepID=UPI001D132A99|nr:arylsulfatase [Alkalihalobacillus deserti]